MIWGRRDKTRAAWREGWTAGKRNAVYCILFEVNRLAAVAERTRQPISSEVEGLWLALQAVDEEAWLEALSRHPLLKDRRGAP